MDFPNKLNLDQQIDLESDVTHDEIKRAVWDCGIDKSPGPDGFTFGFYRRYWSDSLCSTLLYSNPNADPDRMPLTKAK
ncbi:hypothetical protein Tco_0423728, partial [Tanacetum coccineum]